MNKICLNQVVTNWFATNFDLTIGIFVFLKTLVLEIDVSSKNNQIAVRLRSSMNIA